MQEITLLLFTISLYFIIDTVYASNYRRYSDLAVESNNVKASFYAIFPTKHEMFLSFNLIACSSDEDCLNYTPNIDIALALNSTIVETPVCVFDEIEFSTIKVELKGQEEVGYCSCPPDTCYSYSRTASDEKFYYCGPCGRVGSECQNHTCTHSMAECRGDFCECKRDGTFYDLYYCYVPYYGYEVALQMAIATCIIIAGCLILVSIYNAVGLRRFRRLQNIRELIRREGTRTSSLEDTPPKYDDVVEELPSYLEALEMVDKPPDVSAEAGLVNAGFENDENSISSRNNSARKKKTTSEPEEAIQSTSNESSSVGIETELSSNQINSSLPKISSSKVQKKSVNNSNVKSSQKVSSNSGAEEKEESTSYSLSLAEEPTKSSSSNLKETENTSIKSSSFSEGSEKFYETVSNSVEEPHNGESENSNASSKEIHIGEKDKEKESHSEDL